MPETVDKLARNIWGEARIAANLGPSPMDQDKHVERIKKSLAVHAEAIAGRMLKDLEKLKVGKLTRQLEIANDKLILHVVKGHGSTVGQRSLHSSPLARGGCLGYQAFQGHFHKAFGTGKPGHRHVQTFALGDGPLAHRGVGGVRIALYHPGLLP